MCVQFFSRVVCERTKWGVVLSSSSWSSRTELLIWRRTYIISLTQTDSRPSSMDHYSSPVVVASEAASKPALSPTTTPPLKSEPPALHSVDAGLSPAFNPAASVGAKNSVSSVDAMVSLLQHCLHLWLPYPLNMRLGKSERQSGHFLRQRTVSFFCWISNVVPLPHSLVTWY